MEIKKTENENTFELLLIDKESLIIADILGNTYSGPELWRVKPQDFMEKFNISYKRSLELGNLFRDLYKNNNIKPVLLKKDEIDAIKKMTIRLLDLWDEGEFSTMIATDKSKVKSFVDEFDK